MTSSSKWYDKFVLPKFAQIYSFNYRLDSACPSAVDFPGKIKTTRGGKRPPPRPGRVKENSSSLLDYACLPDYDYLPD